MPKLKPGEVDLKELKPVDGEAEQSHDTTLLELFHQGWRLFTPSLICTHGRFDRDPIMEFRAAHPDIMDAEAPFTVDCERPFFSGIGLGVLGPRGQVVDWDRRLYGAHDSIWQRLYDFLIGLTIYERKSYHYARVGSHLLNIIDQTSMGVGLPRESLPQLSVTVFCVSGYRSFAYIAPAKDPPRTLPYLQVEAPRQDIKREAEAVLGPRHGARFKENEHWPS